MQTGERGPARPALSLQARAQAGRLRESAPRPDGPARAQGTVHAAQPAGRRGQALPDKGPGGAIMIAADAVAASGCAK